MGRLIEPNRGVKYFIYFFIIFILISDGFFYEYGGMHITAGRFFSVILVVFLTLYALYRGAVAYGGMPGLLLLSWMLFSLAVDISSPVFFYSLIHHWLNIAVGVAWFYIVVNFRPDWRILQRSIASVATCLGLLSCVVIIARIMSLDPWGITDYLAPRVVDLFRLVMFSWEPNIFGGVMALALVVTLPLLDMEPRRYALPSLLMLIALLGSLSKGPWLAFFVGFTFYTFMARTKRIVSLYLGMLTVCLFAAALVFLIHPDIFSSSIVRAENVDVRWVQAEYAFKDIQKSPIWGSGTFSFGDIWPYLNYRFGDMQIGSAWIGQTVLGVLHDTGFIGLLLFVGFWSALLFNGIKVIGHARRQPDKLLLYFSISIVSAQIMLMAQGLATTLYALPIYWAMMGLAALLPVWLRNRLPGCSSDVSPHSIGWASE